MFATAEKQLAKLPLLTLQIPQNKLERSKESSLQGEREARRCHYIFAAANFASVIAKYRELDTTKGHWIKDSGYN